jgi:hypothetical protein
MRRDRASTFARVLSTASSHAAADQAMHISGSSKEHLST